VVTGAGGGEPEVVAARGAGEEAGVAACGAGGLGAGNVAARGAGDGATRGAGDRAARGTGDGATRGAGEEVVGGAPGAQSGDGPVGKSLCGDPIGAITVSDVSRNSRVAGGEGPSRSAKGKAVSSKMMCLEMIIWLEDMSRQRYPLW
jgi:hypothetical protein